MFSAVLGEGYLPGPFPFRGRLRLSAVSHPQQFGTATRDTVVPMNIEVPTKYPAESRRQNRCFTNTSPQRQSDALQASILRQLRYFESHYKGAQG